MLEDQELYAKKLERWQIYMERYCLPDWDSLPDMELYVDQLVNLVSRYLELIPQDEKNPVVTASIINNYVRLKVMPAPVKKRYRRQHLAYVVMICTLKQCMTLTEIQKFIPASMDEAQTRRVYNDFVARISATARLFIDQVNAVAKQELREGKEGGCMNLVMHSAVSSVLYKLLTVKLTNLKPAQPQAQE
ncbi:MAG TPA: DUF1836 domain-containing protein [Candidatus Faecousia intestinigallinarum]|nr:DUF1836 domain-containing protein [Candidatus Faecousia intestinigallinarum]